MPGIGIRIGPSRQRGKSAAIFVGMVLSGSGSQAEGVATGTAIGSLSVVGGTGSYTFTKTADPDSAFTLTAGVLKNAIVFDYETAASHSVTLHADNGAGSTFDLTVGVAVTDVAAPVLSAATGTKTGSSTATLGVTTNVSDGTLYAVATTSATNPTAAQVKAGQDHTGAAASFAGNAAISSSGAKTINATGLTASTAYFGHFMHEGLPAEQSAVVASASFTTDALAAPVNTVAPAVSGTETQGSTLSTTNGTWTNSPTSYTYQWMRSVTSGGVPTTTGGGEYIGVAISSATASTYVLQAGDVGEIIFCEVTAHNAGGATPKTSNVTGVIASSSTTNITTAQPNNHTTWTKTNSVVASTTQTAPDSSGTASELAQSVGGLGAFTQIAAAPDPLIAGTSYKLTGYAKIIAGTPWLLVAITDKVTHNAGTSVNLTTHARGTDLTSGFGAVDNVVVTDVGSGWNKIELTFHVTSNMADTTVILGWETADNTINSDAGDQRYQFWGWGV